MNFLILLWKYSYIFGVWPMTTYINFIRPSSLVFALETRLRINMWSLFQRILTLYALPFENVTCRMENVHVYIRWFEKECFFLIDPVILYLLLPQTIKIQLIWIQIIYFQITWIQLYSDNLFRRKYLFLKLFLMQKDL